MPKVDSKTANLAILRNFDVIEKMNAGFRISGQKLKKFESFQTNILLYIIPVEKRSVIY